MEALNKERCHKNENSSIHEIKHRDPTQATMVEQASAEDTKRSGDNTITSMVGCDDIVSVRKSREEASADETYGDIQVAELKHNLVPVVVSSEEPSYEFSAGSLPVESHRPMEPTKLAQEVHSQALKLAKVHEAIASLYLKIKRCSKDISITESQYLRNYETEEDRDERYAIKGMDPLVLLNYINVSIDVIINLKFEDIESKMRDHGATGGSS